MNSEEVSNLRRDYEAAGLHESEMADDPFAQFEQWFSAASDSGVEQPNAFVLATATLDGIPSARAVLMKEFNEQGLVFYTSMNSAKSSDLGANPRAAATFVWIELHRQVRFSGDVVRVTDDEADVYFATRPRGAQIAAHASNQSETIADREVLDQRFEAFERQFEGSTVPRPDNWGGWRLRPDRVEFWQGQPNRFHDRVRFVSGRDGWRKERLAP